MSNRTRKVSSWERFEIIRRPVQIKKRVCASRALSLIQRERGRPYTYLERRVPVTFLEANLRVLNELPGSLANRYGKYALVKRIDHVLLSRLSIRRVGGWWNAEYPRNLLWNVPQGAPIRSQWGFQHIQHGGRYRTNNRCRHILDGVF